MKQRIDDIEILRGVSILLVLVQHVPYHLFSWMPYALSVKTHGYWVGVDIFLAVSGFVIARQLLPRLDRARGNAALATEVLAFWTRRAWRLWPAAWLWLAITLAGVLAFNRSGVFGSVHANLDATMAGIFQFANWRLFSTFMVSEYGASLHYWSLSLEEQFYLALPLLALLTGRRLWLALVAITLFQFAQNNLGSVFRFEGLAIGVLVAQAMRWNGIERLNPRFLARPSVRYPLFAGVVGALVLLGGIGRPWIAYPQPVITLLCGLLVFCAAFDKNYFRFPAWVQGCMLWAGSRSYAIYLAHLPIFGVTRELFFRVGITQPNSSNAIAMSLTASALLFSAVELTYRRVETPLRAHGARIAASLRTRTALPSGTA